MTIDQVFIPKSKVASLVSVTQRDAASLAERRILQQEEVKPNNSPYLSFSFKAFLKFFETFRYLAIGGGQMTILNLFLAVNLLEAL